MSRIISIDYGLRRIGIAVSDPDRIFAFPLCVIENKKFSYVLEQLEKIIAEKEPSLLLIGLPLNMDKTKSEMSIKVEKFIKALKEKITIPIELYDERLSSFQAEENLRSSGLSAKQSKGLVDSEAARLLLEEYINRDKTPPFKPTNSGS